MDDWTNIQEGQWESHNGCIMEGITYYNSYWLDKYENVVSGICTVLSLRINIQNEIWYHNFN